MLEWLAKYWLEVLFSGVLAGGGYLTRERIILTKLPFVFMACLCHFLLFIYFVKEIILSLTQKKQCQKQGQKQPPPIGTLLILYKGMTA